MFAFWHALVLFYRYIFEDKETKKGDSADKTAKGAKSKNLPQQKVIARLQVSILDFIVQIYKFICVLRNTRLGSAHFLIMN